MQFSTFLIFNRSRTGSSCFPKFLHGNFFAARQVQQDPLALLFKATFLGPHLKRHAPSRTCNGRPKTLDWLYNGTMPQSAADMQAIAAFCVKQNLPDALSWLVLQCGIDTLDFDGQNLGDQGAQMIASWLERCPRPIAMDLKFNQIGKDGAVALAGVLKNHATLTSLDVGWNDFGDTGAIALADALLTNSTLTSLGVSSNKIGAAGGTEFANVLRTNLTLTSLSLGGNDIGDTGATAFADALTTNSTLTSLGLALNGISATGATALANALKTKSALTSLDVNTNKIGATGATALADALQTNSTLTSLNVRQSYIGTVGTTALAKGLKANSTLSSLDASYNDIDATGSLAFADSLETNTMLTTLKLRESRFVTDKSAMAFVAHRINANKRSKLFAARAVESLVMLASSQNSYFPSEVGALIVQDMITLGPDQGDGAQGLESLVVASSIVQKRELAIEAFQTLPTSWESKLPPEVGAMIVENMISLGPGQGDGVQGMDSLVYESAIAKLRERDKKG